MAQREFIERWVTHLMEAVDGYVDEQTKIVLMESCRRACAQQGALKSAKKCGGDIDKLLATLEKWIGKGDAHKDGNVVHLVYPKCFCHLVAKGPDHLPDTHCLCSIGWLKELFETVAGHQVEAALLQSVKRRADQCRFTVTL